MSIYIRCSKCHYKEKAEGNSFGNFECPKCLSNTVDIKTGSPPSWWAAEDESKKIQGLGHDQ